MSARVTPEEYSTLQVVPYYNYSNAIRSARCDVSPGHALARTMMQTPDHRAIALCDACYRKVLAAKAS